MILLSGGIKGGQGKSLIASSLAILRSKDGYDTLWIDSDPQNTVTDFTALRNEEVPGGAGYTAIQLYGKAIRTDVPKLEPKYDDIIIDVSGRDSEGQRAALLIADIIVIPFFPASFDIWALEQIQDVVKEARIYNQDLKAYCFLNRADSRGSDNDQAVAIAKEFQEITYLDTPLINRKAYRTASASGLAVTELKPPDPKASAEIRSLYQALWAGSRKKKGGKR